ncbi:MAG: hypothetical protein JWO78_825 [Micavibrio sp.]|nr:hypothetical protein [Micavibrio sp.]
MSAQMTAPFSGVYGDEIQKTPPKPEAAERDSKFQNFMSKLVDSLHDSDVNSRDQKTKFSPLDALSGRQMKDDTEKVVKYQGPATAGAGVAAAAAPNPKAAKEMNALLKTEQNAKPLDGPRDATRNAANAETASQGAKNKGQQAERGAETLVKKANDIAAKMNPQEIAAMQPKGGNLAGPLVEMGAHLASPKLGIAVTTAAAVASTGQGQGTHSTEKTASKPILSKSEERAMAKAPTYYYDQAPQAIASPSQATTTAQFFDKMGKGPGFDMGRLASQDSLQDLKIGNIAKVVEDSPAMKSLKIAGLDADNTKENLLKMKDNGILSDEKGKQQYKPEVIAAAAPSPSGFRA